MKYCGKKLLSLLLAAATVIGLFAGISAFSVSVSATEGGAELYDLRVNDQRNPVGVDDTKPTFSWKMRSDETGAAQTAYAIRVSHGDTTLWDSGWVAKSDSIGIDYAGAALEASTEYLVCVSVRDQNGEILTTEGTFETGLMGNLGSAKWISLKSDSNFISTTTSYTIDFDFTLQSGSQGFIFGMKDTKNYIMWQVNAVKGSNVLLRPHFKVDGAWKTPVEVNISSALGYNSANLIGKTVHQRIVVSGSVIKTYFGPNEGELTLANTFDCKKYSATSSISSMPLYNLGFRQNTSSGGGTEICSYDNIRVSNSSGKLLYEQDFSGYYVLSNRTGYSVQNGALKGGSATKGEYLTALKANGVNSLPAFRRSFQTRSIVSAKLYTSGLGVYESYINGQRVGRLLEDGTVEYHELKPGFTEMSRRKFYSAYDVTWMLESNGENVLSAMVSGGWWSGTVGANYGTEDAYWATLILRYSDGTTQTIVTDTNWKAAKESPLQKGTGIFEGERYNAGISTDWMLPGYDDTVWSKAKVNTEFTGKLVAWDGEYVTVRKDLERTPVEMYVYKGVSNESADYYGTVNVLRTYEDGESITLKQGETLVVDFGQNFSGWEAFTVSGGAGTRIHVEHGEMRNDGNGAISRHCDGPEGSVYNGNYREATADTYYTLSGNGAETYHPSHTYYGFRYASFTATGTVTLTGIRGQVVTSVREDTAWLSTSDEDVNQLISNIRWGMYSNYLSIPTDCPQRSERMGWTGDAQSFAEAGAYLGYNKSFLEKYLVDLRDTQKSDGRYAGTAPTGSYGGATFGALGWADAGIIIPYYLYVIYGDKTTLSEHWNSMVLYMDTYMASTGGMGGAHNYGDHVSSEANDTEIKNMLGVSYYAWDALLMSEMATALGKTSAATKYLKLYETEKALFQSLYVQKDGSLKRDVQTVCLYALYLDLLPNQKSVDMVTQQLLSNIQRNGNKMQTGFLGTEIIMHTLTKIGRSDVAYQLLLQHNSPSWLFTVDQGATTMWESWTAYTKAKGFATSRNSYNHYSFGAVAGWMFRGMAGISYDTQTPGFKHIILSPQPDPLLSSVDATYESVYGPIHSGFRYEGDRLHYSFSIPANTTATVYLPVEQIKTLTVDGGSVEEAEGLRLVAYVDGIAQFEAQSGTYNLSSQLAAKTYVTVDVNHDASVPLASTNVYCNGQPVATELPVTLEVKTGDVITADITPENGVDYAVTDWSISGGETYEGSYLYHVVEGTTRITANVGYIGYENLALGATVSAAQHNTAWSSSFLTDGVLNTLGGTRGWSSSVRNTDNRSFTEFYAVIDLGEKKSFNRFQMYPRDYDVSRLEGFPMAYTIYISDNKTDWTAVYTVDGGQVPANIYTPAVIQLDKTVSARYVRLGVTRVNRLDVNKRAFVQMNEFGVYCVEDLEEKQKINIQVNAPASVPIESMAVTVNGKALPSELSGEVYVRPGDVVTVSVKPMNAVDYGVLDWSFSDGRTLSGAVLRFTAERSVTVTANVGYTGYENLAVGAAVSAAQHNTSWSSSFLTDGVLNTLGGTRGWSSSSRGTGNRTFSEFFAVIDLGEQKEFNRFQMYPRNYDVSQLEGFPMAYTIYVSDNKTDWTAVYTVDGGALPANLYSPVTIQLEENVEGRYVRLGVTRVNRLDANKRAFVQLNEFGVYQVDQRTLDGVSICLNSCDTMPLTDVSVGLEGVVVSNLLPGELTALPGETVSLSASTMNSVDFAVTGWKVGDSTLMGNSISFVVEKAVTVTPIVEYIGYENLALGASASAEERSSNWSAAYLTDGVLNTFTTTNVSWSSLQLDAGNMAFEETFATIDLGKKMTFNRLQLYARDSGITVPVGFPRAYTIYVSNDNSTWRPVYTTKAGATPDNLYDPSVVQLPYGVNARYVRIGVTEVACLDSQGRAFVHLNELGVYLVKE